MKIGTMFSTQSQMITTVSTLKTIHHPTSNVRQMNEDNLCPYEHIFASDFEKTADCKRCKQENNETYLLCQREINTLNFLKKTFFGDD